MFALAQSGSSLPANAAGIVTTAIGLAFTIGWFVYLYR